MRRIIGLALVAALLGGCVVYASPYEGHRPWRYEDRHEGWGR